MKVYAKRNLRASIDVLQVRLNLQINPFQPN